MCMLRRVGPGVQARARTDAVSFTAGPSPCAPPRLPSGGPGGSIRAPESVCGLPYIMVGGGKLYAAAPPGVGHAAGPPGSSGAAAASAAAARLALSESTP